MVWQSCLYFFMDDIVKNYYLNTPLPDGWTLLKVKDDGFMWFNLNKGLTVISSIAKEQDGKTWLHVSFSRKSRIPDYKDIVLIKRLFIGDNNQAIQVFPKKKDHVNIHPYCLHLWHCIDGCCLPDFTQGMGTI